MATPRHAWQHAVAIAWPPPAMPEIVISEFHLREMLDKHLKRLGVPPADPLRDLVAAAFRGPTQWAVLVAALTPIAAGDRKLNSWLAKWDGRIANQLARHAFRHTTRSTGGIEQHLRRIYQRIEDRRHMFANRERLNRLLMLMTIEMRGSLDEREWAKVIRSWLLVTGGVPPLSRQITDHVGGPRKTSSLRLGGAPT